MAGPNSIPFWTDLIANPDPASFTNPPDAWSVVFMGSNLTLIPGLLENGDVSWRKPPHRVIDHGRKPSTDGATPKLLGIGCAEFDLKLIIHAPTQLNTLAAVLPQIWPGKSSPITISPNTGTAISPGSTVPGPQFLVGLNLTQTTPGGGSAPKGGKDSPILVYHPSLALAGISQCIIEKWTPPVRWNGKNDIKMYVLHCLEFRQSNNTQTTTPVVLGPPINVKTLPVSTPTTPPSQNGAGPGLTF